MRIIEAHIETAREDGGEVVAPERVFNVIELRAADCDCDPAVVIAWARERIAAYKAPKSVDFIDILPRNASGKVLRRELRKPYWEGLGRNVG